MGTVATSQPQSNSAGIYLDHAHHSSDGLATTATLSTSEHTQTHTSAQEESESARNARLLEKLARDVDAGKKDADAQKRDADARKREIEELKEQHAKYEKEQEELKKVCVPDFKSLRCLQSLGAIQRSFQN